MRRENVSTRRRFFFSASAALSAPIVLTLARDAAGSTDDSGVLQARLAALEDANAIRELQRAYARHVNAQAHAAATQLFADPHAAQLALDASIRALTADVSGAEDGIEIAADRQSATARMHCTVRIEAPIEAPGCTLVDMARLQGEGVLKRTERRLLEQTFVRQGGVWKIERAAYLSAAKAG